MKEYKLFKCSEENQRLDNLINSLVADEWELVKVFDDKNTVLMVREVKQKRTKSKQKANE